MFNCLENRHITCLSVKKVFCIDRATF